MNINYDGGENINTPNIFPSNEAFATKNFTLTGKSTTSDNMNYHIILVIEENTFTNNALEYKLTSTNTDGNGTVAPSIIQSGIANGDQEIYLGDGTFESPADNKEHSYKLELYFPDTIEDQNDDMNKTFKAYINIREGNYNFPGYNPEKGVNHPVLFTGMTPVKWNENNEETETTEDDSDWYDYDEKKWANAKSADGSYWVWIPRYAYKIESCYHTSVEDCLALTGKEAGDIDVKFLKSSTNISSDNTLVETIDYEPGSKDTSTHYFLHPALQFNGDELGFWMAKYEASSHDVLKSGITSSGCNSEDNVSTKRPKIVPNAVSWRCINNSNAFKASLAMKDNPIYGWNSSEVDTHMLTNNEWGAVAYLSKSQYGAPSEVWNNSYNGFQTGCSGPSVSAHSQTTCTEYHTENGQYASTTHNIYGVYDMSGGAWDRVMGNYNNMIGSSGFGAEELSRIHPKYITKYYTAPEDLNNGYGVNYDVTVFGDGVHETSHNANRYNGSSWDGVDVGSWYSDHSYLPYLTSYPWFNRGAYWGSDWGSGTDAGVFSFHYHNGSAYWANSFRVSLFPL